MTTEKSFMNVDEVAAYLGISRNTVYWWVATKKIPHCKFGKLVRFGREDISAWLKEKSRSVVG